MSYKARRARAGMERYARLEARQAATSKAAASTKRATTKSSALPQPTTVIALTDAFTPPATCAENRLTMIPPAFMIWANEPFPADLTSTACFPSEFMQAYTSVASSTFGSSIVPAMSPLVCPSNYCPMFSADNNYLACCPSGYGFTPPDKTIISKRPAYGGTCYSEFTSGIGSSVTQYDESGSSSVIAFTATATHINAYAHPIDGFAPDGSTIVVGCQTPIPLSSAFVSLSTSTSPASSKVNAMSATPSETSAPTAASTKMSSGVIAGATIGAVAGLAGLIFLVWFILGCLRKRRDAAARPAHHQLDDTQTKAGGAAFPIEMKSPTERYEKDGSVFVYEMGTHEKFGSNAALKPRNSQMNDGQGAFEMHGDQVPELEGEDVSKAAGGKDQKIGFAT